MDFDLKNIGSLLSRGVIGQLAPEILKGAILEFFKAKGLDSKAVTDCVLRDASLWDLMGEKLQGEISALLSKSGNINFLDSQFVIKAIKGEHPAVASLFLGWVDARNWLDKQVETIKNQVHQPAT